MTKKEYDTWQKLKDPTQCERCKRSLTMRNVAVLGKAPNSKEVIGYCVPCIAKNDKVPAGKGMKMLVME